MSVLDRYVTRQCLVAIATVVAVLALLTLLFALIEELDDSHPGYGFMQALEYLMLTMPRRIEELMSYGVFIGLLLALGNLSEGGELTAFRAAGVSPYRILAALSPALGVCLLFALTMSEFVSPAGERAAEQLKRSAIARSVPSTADQAREAGAYVTPQDGIWLRRPADQGAEFVHIAGMNRSGEITDIQIYELDENNRLLATRHAEKGVYHIEENNWRLYRVSSTRLSKSNSQSFKEAYRDWNNSVTPEQLASQAFSDPRKMTLMQIWNYMARTDQHRSASIPFELHFWGKLMAPVVYLSMALMALAVVLGPLRHTGVGQRLTLGIFIGLVFKYLQDLFAPMAAVFSLPSALAVLLPALIYLYIGHKILKKNA